MPLIPSVTISLATYHPLRPFPGLGYADSHLSGWLANVLRLPTANEIQIIERVDEGVVPETANFPLPDFKRCRLLHWPNDPPYIDPTRGPAQEDAANDWVLFLDDDERMSEGMIRFLACLSQQDPFPSKDWAAVRFPREDYLYYNGLWRYIPANGADPQIRLVNRERVHWPGTPHNTPEIDGMILSLTGQDMAILHYREYAKVVRRTDFCNGLFVDQERIVAMQTAYVERVRGMLGVG